MGKDGLNTPLERLEYIIDTYYGGSGTKLCIATGLQDSQLSRIRKGKTTFTYGLMERIAKGTPYITTDWLRNGETKIELKPVEKIEDNTPEKMTYDRLKSEYNKLVEENNRLKKAMAILISNN